jgi:hypothetical protein
MASVFKFKDLKHCITAKFFPACLPTAKKAYNLRAVYQPELDIHGIASKAEIYNISTPSKVIEEGMIAGMELIYYLAADGYKINTPVFYLQIGTPGEYDGHETQMPEGLYPYGQISITAKLRKYLKENIKIQFDGVALNEGYIETVIDRISGKTDTVVTAGGLFVMQGIGLKIVFDERHASDAGLFYECVTDGSRIREEMVNIAQNDPTLITALCRGDLETNKEYRIVVCTQSPIRGGNRLLKNVREVKSDFSITVE